MLLLGALAFGSLGMTARADVQVTTTTTPTPEYELSSAPALGNLSAHVPLNALSPETLRTFVTTFDLVRRKYAEPVDDETLFRHAISGMLTSLDDHAEFLDETAFRNLQEFTEGSLADVGLEVYFNADENHWVITHINLDTVGGADIAVGDYLHQIGDKKIDTSFGHEDIVQLLSGIAGTQVELVVSRAGRNKHSIKLQRTNISNQRLSVLVYDNIAIVKLPIFTERTRHELTESLVRIQQPIKGIILDVRNNPGGVLSSAVNVASLFVKDSPVVQVVERDRVVQTLRTSDDAPLNQMPVIVLQNRYSASAAEVLAQALKSNGKLVVGETSYGKGSIQSILPLGKSEAIKLTTAHYTATDGSKINGIGISPNTQIDLKDPNWLAAVLKVMDTQKLEVGILLSPSNDY